MSLVQKNPQQSRLAALDGLRGLLAATVMAVHVAAHIHPGPVLMLSQIPVAIFFVMSGLVLTRAWDGRYGLFLLRRIARLWPVYAVSLALGYLLAWRQPLWPEFLWMPWPSYDGDVINGPVWSLFIEAWAAPLMPLFVAAARAGRVQTLLLGLAFVVGGRFFAPLLFGALFVLGAYLARGSYRNAFLERPVPQWLGKISYSLYLTHWLVLKAGVQLLGPLGALAAVPVALCVAWCTWRWVELPSIALSRAIGRRRQVALAA